MALKEHRKIQLKELSLHRQKGQALLEGVMSLGIICLLLYGLIETIRLISAKYLLQGFVNEIGLALSHKELQLIQKYHYANNPDKQKEAELQISADINNLSEQFFSSSKLIALNKINISTRTYVNILNVKNLSGFNLHINLCLPLLFSKEINYFPIGDKLKKSAKPALVGEESFARHDCLGMFNSKPEGVFFFSLHAEAKVAWTPAKELFLQGITLSDANNSLSKIKNITLSSLIEKSTQNKININMQKNPVILSEFLK